jgi:hypothetical protein
MMKTAKKVTNCYKKFMGNLQCWRDEFLNDKDYFLKDKNISIMILDSARWKQQKLKKMLKYAATRSYQLKNDDG